MAVGLFEGSEKKMEVVFSSTTEPLRRQPSSVWNKLCQRAGARVISALSSSHCDSYILSESSLFVWDHRLLMLTCGRSPLVKALKGVLKKWRLQDIDLLFFQRKNELVPRHQQSSFMEDASLVRTKVPGTAYAFGSPDEHHFYLFHSTHRERVSLKKDRTIEVLMYDLNENVKNLFLSSKGSRDDTLSEIREHLKRNQIMECDQIDDHIFQPFGYSLNGLKGKEEYFTIHVTAQEPGFYVSFETNFSEEPALSLIARVINTFQPSRFDTVLFTNHEEGRSNTPFSFEGFTPYSHFKQRLECGYEVCFSHFFENLRSHRRAFPLSLKKEARFLNLL